MDYGAISNFAGPIFGAAAGMISGATSARKQYKYQSKLNQQAYDLTQRGYRESYGNMRIGLENAGYNPLLAVNGGMSGATFSGGSATGASYDGSGYANAFTNAKQQKSQEKLNDATIGQLESQIGVNNAEASYKEGLLQSEIIKQSGYDLDNAIKDLQRQKEQKELSIWDKKLLAELENIQNDTTLKRAYAYQAQMDALSNRINAHASTTNAKTGEINAITNRRAQISNDNSTPYRTVQSYFRRRFGLNAY